MYSRIFASPPMSVHSADRHFFVVAKGDQRYVIVCDDGQRREALRAVCRFARNPDLNFTWQDAVALTQTIRQDVKDS